MVFERFDVLTALFSFVDVPVRKPRPILVLSTAAFNDAHGQVVSAMITTAAGSRWTSDHPIIDLGLAGLKHPSVVRLKLFTLPVTVIGRAVGRLGPEDRRAVKAQLDPILCGAA